MLCFYNTLTGKKEPFLSLEHGRVSMYTCGPTVYTYSHLGNFRTFVSQDILRRYLKYKGFRLNHVMNYTDVDDKTIRNANESGLDLKDYTNQFIDAFKVDCGLLKIQTPEKVVRATDHIHDMEKMVEGLISKGYAYHKENSTYFRISNFKTYGRLSRINISEIKSGARVDQDEYEKENARDFVLWKASKSGEPQWPTSFGPGRPGWHLECSVMAMKYLGESFDIHSGGTDLIFPHHENEIAQSEALTGKPFVRYWIHVEHLLVEGKKMAKSEGNFYTLRDLLAMGHRPSVIRYLLASVPHRKQLNFTFDALHQARRSIDRLRNFQYRLQEEIFKPGKDSSIAARAKRAEKEFEEALDDDLNTARAFAAIFDLVREGNASMDKGSFKKGNVPDYLKILEIWDRIFAVLPKDKNISISGLNIRKRSAKKNSSVTPFQESGQRQSLTDPQINALIEDRNKARQNRDFVRADQIRKNLELAGVTIGDAKAGTRWKRK